MEMHEHDANSQDHHISDDRTKELMAIHDSIMPATETIMKLKSQISAEINKADSLLALKPDKALKTRKAKALEINALLKLADDEMMDWMHQYRADSLEKLDDEQATVYITDQKQKIDAVRNLMKRSIRDAELFIQKN